MVGRALTVLLVTLVPTSHLLASPNQIPEPIPVQGLGGSLYLTGDSTAPKPLVASFIQDAGGKDARIVVVSDAEVGRSRLPGGWPGLASPAGSVVRVAGTAVRHLVLSPTLILEGFHPCLVIHHPRGYGRFRLGRIAPEPWRRGPFLVSSVRITTHADLSQHGPVGSVLRHAKPRSIAMELIQGHESARHIPVDSPPV